MEGLFDEEAYEERAAIMEYDGGLPRALAERFAKMEDNVRKERKKCQAQ